MIGLVWSRRESTATLLFSCFTIACKLESRRVPDGNSLLALFDSRYQLTQADLHHGEKQLLTQLDFELGLFLPSILSSTISLRFSSRISSGDPFPLLLPSICSIPFRDLFSLEIRHGMCPV